MGADASFFYFGVRYLLDSDEELDAVETRTDDRVRRAKRARLKTALGRPTNGEPHFLLIGAELAVLGIENDTYVAFGEAQLISLVAETRKKLLDAGFSDEPAFRLQLVAQY